REERKGKKQTARARNRQRTRTRGPGVVDKRERILTFGEMYDLAHEAANRVSWMVETMLRAAPGVRLSVDAGTTMIRDVLLAVAADMERRTTRHSRQQAATRGLAEEDVPAVPVA